VQFEQVDFVARPATSVTFPEPETVLPPDGKRVSLILVEGTARTPPRMLTQSELIHKHGKRQLFLCFNNAAHCPPLSTEGQAGAVNPHSLHTTNGRSKQTFHRSRRDFGLLLLNHRQRMRACAFCD
jgi:hypothetical protein